ncbi:MAG: glutathione binding-like protein, partial [Cyanobacteriota bacterium]
RLSEPVPGSSASREFIAGAYSIADIAAYPWIVPYEKQNQKIEDFPNLQRWFEAIKARPATIRAYEKAEAFKDQVISPEQSRDLLFNQSADTVKR